MANNGARRGKPAWSASNKSKYFFKLVIGFLVVLIIAFVLRRSAAFPNFSDSVPLPNPIEFIRNSPQPSPTPSSITIHLRAVGDVMLSRSVGLSATERNNWRWPFEGTTPYLPAANLLIGNLEAPLTDPCQLKDHVMSFCVPTKAIDGLTYAGFDVLSLANNHTLNYGPKGLSDTKATLTAAGIEGIENYQTKVITVNGQPLGLLALDDVSAPLDEAQITAALKTLAPQTDTVIVLIHWGNEYEPNPSPRQRAQTKMLIDQGADIILGTHPHVLEPIEREKNALVVYSLGNFVFDQMWSPETRESLVLDLDLTFNADRQLTHIDYTPYPATIYDYGQPRLDQ